MEYSRRNARQHQTPNFFLVQYLCDSTYQVRRRAFIKSENVRLQGIYVVQWGRLREKDRARILGSGTEEEMRALMIERQSSSSPQSPTPPSSPWSPTPPPQREPPKKRQPKTTQKKTKVAAKVISVTGRTSGRDTSTTPITSTPLRRPRSEDTTPVTNTNSTINTNVTTASAPGATKTATTTPATPSITSPIITPGTNTSAAPTPVFAGHPNTPQDTTDNTGYLRTITNQLKSLQNTVNIISQDLRLANTKLDAANRRILRLEAIGKGLSEARPEEPVAPQSTNEDRENLQSRIPEDLRIADNILASLHQEANNPGHFACLLLKKLFEELFLTGTKVNFNWYGGGSKGKKELDVRRKKVIQTYVEHFHPEVKDPAVWRDRVVARINECLRRPKKLSKASTQVTDDTIVPSQEDANQLRPQLAGAQTVQELSRPQVPVPLTELQEEQQRPHGPLTAFLYADI